MITRKPYVVVVRSSEQVVKYHVTTPEEIITFFKDQRGSVTPALVHMMELAVAGHTILVISPGTIESVNGTRRENIPEQYMLPKNIEYHGDFLAVKSTLTTDDFVIRTING